MAASELGRSQDLYVAPVGSKPRTPGSATLVRTRSTDGRRSAHSGPHHEVIPLNSTTSKSFSANHMLAHPLVLPSAAASPASSIVGGLPPQSPYTGGATPSGAAGAAGLLAQQQAGARGRTPPEIAISTASSRFNPVVEDDDALPPLPAQQQQPEAGSTSGNGTVQRQQQGPDTARESHVVLSGSAAAIAQRPASSSTSSNRRYAAAESVALSTQQRPLTGEGGDGGGGAAPERYLQDESEVPATPGSVASGRIGGVFFTDLHRSFGGSRGRGGVGDSQDLRGALGDGEGEDEDADDGGGAGPRASRQARISAMTSRLNPMQSPTTSEDGDDDGDEDDAAFAEYAGEEALRPAADTGSGSGAAEEGGLGVGRRASTSAMTDYTNPVQTPYDSRLPTPLLPSGGAAAPPEASASTGAVSTTAESRQSLLLVIRDLYATEPTPRTTADDDVSRPATAASERAEPEPERAGERQEEEAGGEGDAGADEEAALASSRAAVAALARTDSQQCQRRSELGEYMTALQDLKDESGGRLVELPADWGVMLERLFRQRRAEFATLEGWMGPRRFEDLPINQLPSDHPDPRVEEGLARIRELDGVLNDKLIAALISHRETFPEQWAEQERRRLERHTRAVEEALKRERQKRLRAARISRAVTSLDGPAALAADGLVGQGSSRSLAEQPSSIYSRLFSLKPEEEALVEAVLKRNDEEGAAINPFDLHSAATYGGGPEAAATPATPAAGGIGGDEWATADDIDLELDMLLPSASASACATPTAAAAPRLRPLSARLTEADGGGGSGLRPLSASSYSSSRPGTSSGPSGGVIGGLSPIAAAALHGHPALLAAGIGGIGGGGGNPRASAAGGGSGGLLPERVYDDPKAAARALRAINARLAAFESEHLWDESGSLADFKFVVTQPPQQQQGSKAPPASEAGAGPVAAAAAGSVGGPSGAAPSSSSPGAGRAASPPRSVKSAAGGPAASVSGVSVTAGGQRDYLREERLAKELASRERDVDAALRSLKTGEVVRLGEATLKALVEQCRRLQELNEHRRKIEEAEAAARKAQLQRQQLMAARASESGSARGTPRGGSTPSTSGTSKGGQTPPLPTPARGGTGATSAPVDGGAGGSAAAAASGGGGGRAAKPGGATQSGSSGSTGPVAAGAAGSGGAVAPVRQGSAGKSRSGSAAAGTQSSPGPPGVRRASDPASGPAGTSTSPSGPGAAPSSSSKAGRASAAAASVGAAAGSGSGTPKPRSAGRATGQPSPLDGGGGLPPPPPPPPP